MEDSPYENLDTGYFEFPVPNTEEFQTVRFLGKSGLAQLWQKIADKFLKKPTGGEEGQALVKTSTGVAWGDVDAFPDGGTTGQVLGKTETGVAWIDANLDVSNLPHATDTQYGVVKFSSDEDFDEYMRIRSEDIQDVV